MRKFLIKISIFLLYSFLLVVVFPYVVDPFNVFHADNIRPSVIEPNKKYIKMKYILKNPNKFNVYMLGSSRVGAIHTEQIQNENVYNLTTASGNPAEHLDNLKTFIANGLHPSKIYIGVDSLSYTVSPDDLRKDPMRCPYESLCNSPIHFCSLYFQPYDVIHALLLERNEFRRIDPYVFYEYGWWITYDMKSKFIWNKDKVAPSIWPHNRLKQTLNDIEEIVKLCNEHEIELIIFTNPMHHVTYTASVEEKNYFDFLKGLATITNFYNFSSINDVTLSNDCYLETSHYKAKVGDMIIDVICNGKKYDGLYEQGFGVKVTSDNVNDVIKMLKEQMETASSERI